MLLLVTWPCCCRVHWPAATLFHVYSHAAQAVGARAVCKGEPSEAAFWRRRLNQLAAMLSMWIEISIGKHHLSRCVSVHRECARRQEAMKAFTGHPPPTTGDSYMHITCHQSWSQGRLCYTVWTVLLVNNKQWMNGIGLGSWSRWLFHSSKGPLCCHGNWSGCPISWSGWNDSWQDTELWSGWSPCSPRGRASRTWAAQWPSDQQHQTSMGSQGCVVGILSCEGQACIDEYTDITHLHHYWGVFLRGSHTGFV